MSAAARPRQTPILPDSAWGVLEFLSFFRLGAMLRARFEARIPRQH